MFLFVALAHPCECHILFITSEKCATEKAWHPTSGIEKLDGAHKSFSSFQKGEFRHVFNYFISHEKLKKHSLHIQKWVTPFRPSIFQVDF